MKKLLSLILHFFRSFTFKLAPPDPPEEIVVKPDTNPKPPSDHLATKVNLANSVDALIDLRDWLLASNSEGSEASTETKKYLTRIYQKLGQILNHEGIVIYEEAVHFDAKIHQVEGHIFTLDPALTDKIAETVRPGYSIDGKLIRPQEVILYKLQKSV